MSTKRGPRRKLLLLPALLLPVAACTMSEEKEKNPHQHELGGPVHVQTSNWQRMYEFHGHVGPYVALGFRAGELAREYLKSPGYFDLQAEVVSPLKTPQSCFIDGVQLGSGCTVGKRNLKVQEGNWIGVEFQSKSGEFMKIILQQELPERIREWIEKDGLEATARLMLELPQEEVFNIRI